MGARDSGDVYNWRHAAPVAPPLPRWLTAAAVQSPGEEASVSEVGCEAAPVAAAASERQPEAGLGSGEEPQQACSASTTCPEEEPEKVAFHMAQDNTAALEKIIDLQERCEDLVAIVRRECGFMRITGHALKPMMGKWDDEMGRPDKTGAALCLRISIAGLPWVKRAKWQQPLMRTVAALLQRAGCQVIARRSALYLPLRSGAGNAETVRLIFAAGP